MMRSLVYFALALSLLFNVFFAVGYVRARNQARLDGDREATVVRDVTAELQLDDDQRQLFRELRERVGQVKFTFDESLAIAHEERLLELRKPEPDTAEIDAIETRIAELRHERHRATSNCFREFMSALSPEQRERFAHRMHKGPRHRGPRHARILERFDADRDGVLNAEEAAEARAAMAERMRDMGMRGHGRREGWRHDSQRDGQREQRRDHRREEMLRRFDTNGDGRLDPIERAQMPEEFRRRGRGSEGPPPSGHDEF